MCLAIFQRYCSINCSISFLGDFKINTIFIKGNENYDHQWEFWKQRVAGGFTNNFLFLSFCSIKIKYLYFWCGSVLFHRKLCLDLNFSSDISNTLWTNLRVWSILDSSAVSHIFQWVGQAKLDIKRSHQAKKKMKKKLKNGRVITIFVRLTKLPRIVENKLELSCAKLRKAKATC